MGTDNLGRDMFTRVLYGGRVTLLLATLSVCMTLTVGLLLGFIAGLRGGYLDKLIIALMDLLLCFPGILLAIMVSAILGPGLVSVLIAISVFSIPIYTRVVRGKILSVKECEYIEMARAYGASELRIALKHILPNIVSEIVILTSFRFAIAVLWTASLSFIGLGVQPPNAEWGLIMSQGRAYARNQPWITLFPGLIVTMMIVSLNIMGDRLRDYIDPRGRV